MKNSLQKVLLAFILALVASNNIFSSDQQKNNDIFSLIYEKDQKINELEKMYQNVLRQNSVLAQQFMQSQLEKNQLQEQVEQSHKTIQQLISDNAQLVLEVSEFKHNNLNLSRELRKRSSSMSSSTFSGIDENIK
ncbi:MAG: hypothetical protein K2X69_09940 [Silvanigrellaceae bacterium]|nr:hypothetical protein [Silvanigrellaceae bacterium]